MDADTFGVTQESWPSFDERDVVSPCEACGAPADDRQGVDYLNGCPDCGALPDSDAAGPESELFGQEQSRARRRRRGPRPR